MSFDPHSLERLRELGRQLPQTLPPPEAPAKATPAEPRLHAVETEQDPSQLFRELMQASNDGTVPPHLLERLRSLEQTLPAAGRSAADPPAATTLPTPPRGQRRRSAPGSPAIRRASGSDRDLYDAFDDLLNENDDSPDPAPPPARRQADSRLLPRPTLRVPPAR